MGPDMSQYWVNWSTPHHIYALGVNKSILDVGGVGRAVMSLVSEDQAAASPPLGWTVRTVCLAHSETRGGMSGQWSFFVWYLPGRSWCEPLV
jgi:hypothetical protein